MAKNNDICEYDSQLSPVGEEPIEKEVNPLIKNK